MRKRERVCLIYYSRNMPFHPFSSYYVKVHSFHSFLCQSGVSLSQGTKASHLIHELGETRSGLKHEALSWVRHLLVFLRNTDPVTPTFPPSWQLSECGAADQREQSNASCQWPCLAVWKSSLWMSQEGNSLLSLFPLKKHSYTHR